MTDSGDKESCDIRLYLRAITDKNQTDDLNKKAEEEEEQGEDDSDDDKPKEKIWYHHDDDEPRALKCALSKFTADENENSLKRIMTPVFFRYGYYSQMKINLNNFIEKPFVADTWYKIDILIDW